MTKKRVQKDEVKQYWEQRARDYKLDVRGVLFKKPYPQFVNEWFHNWSFKQVSNLVNPKKKFVVLDIACGWGRLSAPLLENYPKLSTVGVDLSAPYVKFYNKLLSPRGKARVGTMEKMAFRTQSVDAAFLVVSLMYLPSADQQEKALTEIFRVLKNKGTFVLIERTPLMGLLDLKKRNHKQISFTKKEIDSLVRKSGGVVKNISSWPMSLLPLYNAYTIEKHE
jgi:ubiquinone/menaquinone biosynthesis C-methylase UbiE